MSRESDMDDYDPEPMWCSIYGKECLCYGKECDDRCMREVRSAEDSDEASDKGDFQCHQRRDQ
jgi:hypothetical protein